VPVLLALASALVYGVGDWLGGRASRVQPSVVVAATGQVVSFALVAVATLAMGTAAPGAATWWWMSFGGIVGALGIAGLYHGFAHGDVAVVAPTSAVVGASLPVVVALVSGERPSWIALVGIVVAVSAVALVSGALGTHRHDTPARIVVLAVLVGACFGLLFVAFDHADPDSGLWPLVIARIASVPLLLLIAGVGCVRPARDLGSIRIAVVAGVFDMGANWLYMVAVRDGLLSVVAVVASLYPASTVALAFAVDKERISRWQACGLGLAVLALVLVTLSRS
jgi:drug/metabolite transporter (DMT)-like permease